MASKKLMRAVREWSLTAQNKYGMDSCLPATADRRGNDPPRRTRFVTFYNELLNNAE